MWLKAALPTWILEWNLTTWLFPSSLQIENVVQCLPHKSTRRARRANSNLRAGIKFQCVPIYKHLRQQKLSLCWCQGAETAWASNHGHARPVEHYGTKNPQRTQVCWTASWIPEHVQLKFQLLKAMQAISHASYPPNLSPASRHMSVSSSWCSFPALHQRRPSGFRGFPGLKSSVHDYRQRQCIHKKRFAHTGKQRRTKEIHASINTCINPLTEMDRKGFTSCDVLMYLTRLELDIRTFTWTCNSGQEIININVWSMRNRA